MKKSKLPPLPCTNVLASSWKTHKMRMSKGLELSMTDFPMAPKELTTVARVKPTRTAQNRYWPMGIEKLGGTTIAQNAKSSKLFANATGGAKFPQEMNFQTFGRSGEAYCMHSSNVRTFFSCAATRNTMLLKARKTGGDERRTCCGDETPNIHDR